MSFLAGAVLMAGVSLSLVLIFKDASLFVLNPAALVIVLGGSLTALCIGFPLERIRNAARDLVGAFGNYGDKEPVIREIIGVARFFKRSDVRATEDAIKGIRDDFLRFGLGLLINQHVAEDIQLSMEREMAVRMAHYQFSQNILKTTARLTPAFGLVGTIIMLIRMFSETHSFETLAPLMAGALMSTLYGVIIANLFMLPLAARVKDKAVSSEMIMWIAMEGVLAIYRGEHPLAIEEKLYHSATDVSAHCIRAEAAQMVRSA
jgi:chemotaxis protein MotA